MESKRLYRDTDHQIISGVAYGIAEYFVVDPVAIRIAFVLLGMFGGGVLIYFICWIAIPSKRKSADTYASPGFTPPENETSQPITAKHFDRNASLIGGLVLIIVGGLFLADHIIPDIHFRDFWSVIFILIGGGLLYRSFSNKK
ncbi:MAG: PspC domain-containing protein [Bacteroidota bacterium]